MKVKALKHPTAGTRWPISALAFQHPNPSTIVIANRQRTRKINWRLLTQIADALLAELEISKPKLEINFVAAGEITRLNETFLKHAGSTDVITFDYANHGGQRLGTPEKIRAMTKRCLPLHGEIFICVDEAVLQARKFRTSWQSEIVRYLIHGILHMLGYDDSRTAQRRKLKREENRLLRKFSRRFSLAQLAGTTTLPACTSR